VLSLTGSRTLTSCRIFTIVTCQKAGVYTKPDTATQLSKIGRSDTSWKTRTQISKSDTFRCKRHGLQEIRHNSRKPNTPLGYRGLAVNAGTIGPLSSFLPPTFSPLRHHTMAGLEALLTRLPTRFWSSFGMRHVR
jgi:hypothetical protein